MVAAPIPIHPKINNSKGNTALALVDILFEDPEFIFTAGVLSKSLSEVTVEDGHGQKHNEYMILANTTVSQYLQFALTGDVHVC